MGCHSLQLVALYAMLFVAVFDLHAQYPMLTPFALSLGATPQLLGWMMGLYALTHIPGNAIAGTLIDRFGSKRFIVISVLGTGVLMMTQSVVTTAEHLVVLRALSGFVIAFLGPACMSMIARYAHTPAHHNTLMSTHGIVQTIATVASPAVGAALVHALGFRLSFGWLGGALVLIGLVSAVVLRQQKPTAHVRTPMRWSYASTIVPFACAIAQSIVYFEIPLLAQGTSLWSQGMLYASLSVGALCALIVGWALYRIAPETRIMWGALALAMCVYALCIVQSASLWWILFLIGMAKGFVFPAIATRIAIRTAHASYGSAFAHLSIVYAIGSFVGPLIAGHTRTLVSPCVVAALVLLATLAYFGAVTPRATSVRPLG
jgi:MFS family permease